MKKYNIPTGIRQNEVRFGVENIDNKFGIANSVCLLLNNSGGTLWCFKNGKPFINEEKAIVAGKNTIVYLKKSITNFSAREVKMTVEGKTNIFIVVFKVRSSNHNHVLTVPKPFINNNDIITFDQDLLSHFDYIRNKIKTYLNRTNDLEESGINTPIKYFKMIHKYQDGYYKIGDFAKGSKHYYKYMTLENVLLCLQNSNIWFVEPAKWNDKFENFYYGATILGKKCSNNNPLLYATCVTNKKDSESAWKIYSDSQNSGSHCVELIINRKEFRKQLLNARAKESNSNTYRPLSICYDIYEGQVSYEDEQNILNLYKPKIIKEQKEVINKEYLSCFRPFTFENYLNLMLLKRDAFRHESETRIFIVPRKWRNHNHIKNHSHLDIKIDWRSVIEGVRYDSHCSAEEINCLLNEIKKKFKIRKNDSLPPDFIFKSYDVYDGPEPPTIM